MKSNLKVPEDSSLPEFLSSKLGGSSLAVRSASGQEFFVESGDVMRVHVVMTLKPRRILFDLYSPKWERKITVEQLDGYEFLESHAEEELQKQNTVEIAEDVLLSLDLIRSWAKANSFEAIEVESDGKVQKE